MTAITDPAALVGLGGAIGAVARYLLGEAIPAESFPFGTLTVNVLGSFVLGFVTFLGVGEELLLFVGTGACGSFTTFSSFSVDTVGLYEDGQDYRAIAFATANLLGAALAIGLAWLLAGGVTG
jgi:CrcB protein